MAFHLHLHWHMHSILQQMSNSLATHLHIAFIGIIPMPFVVNHISLDLIWKHSRRQYISCECIMLNMLTTSSRLPHFAYMLIWNYSSTNLSSYNNFGRSTYEKVLLHEKTMKLKMWVCLMMLVLSWKEVRNWFGT
jgi:hypothetical protein